MVIFLVKHTVINTIDSDIINSIRQISPHGLETNYVNI